MKFGVHVLLFVLHVHDCTIPFQDNYFP